MIPDDMLTEDEYQDEMEGWLHYYDDVIDMLKQRLEDEGLPSCICSDCLNKWREEKGEKLQ